MNLAVAIKFQPANIRDLTFSTAELKESINIAPKATTQDTTEQAWDETASGYASNVGKASTSFAQRLVDLADSVSPMDEESSVLDVGAGTGAVTMCVARKHADCHIAAVDISPSMLAVIDEFNNSNIRTKAIDAVHPGTPILNKYSHAFSSFMLQTTTAPMKVLENIHDRLEDNGIVGLAVWGPHIDPEAIWEKACQTIDPTFEFEPILDDPSSWRTIDQLKEHMESAGFTDVVVEDVTTPFEFDSTDEFMDFWFNGKNPEALLVINRWKGDMELAREATRKICREKYDNGKGLRLQASLGVGRKSI